MIPLVGGTHRIDLMRMNNFVKVSQFDLTLKKGEVTTTESETGEICYKVKQFP